MRPFALAFPGEARDGDEIVTPTRRFTLAEITSGLPDDSREEDERTTSRHLRELRGCVKRAGEVVAATPGLAETLQHDWKRAAQFYARFGITQKQFRCGIPADVTDVNRMGSAGHLVLMTATSRTRVRHTGLIAAFALAMMVAAVFLAPMTRGFASSGVSGVGHSSVPHTFHPAASAGLSPASQTNLANTVVAKVPVGINPVTPAYDSANDEIYVPDSGPVTSYGQSSGNVSVISGLNNTVVATVAVVPYPGQPTFDPANGDIYVPGGFNLSVISGSTNRVIATLPGCSATPTYDPADGDLYLACGAGIFVISGLTNTIVAWIPAGSALEQPALDPSNGDLYAPDDSPYNLTVISTSTNSVVATLPVGTLASGAVYDNANGEIYVPSASGTVAAILGSTNKVVSWIPLGANPSAPAYDSSNGDVYVAFGGDGEYDVGVISGSTNQVVAMIPVGSCPWTPSYDSANQDVYVPDYCSNEVSVISGFTNSLVATVPIGPMPPTLIGSEPGLPMVDNENGDIYVANGNNVSVIGGGFTVKFTESGLSGQGWTISLENEVRSGSAGSPIEFEATDGSWYWFVGAVVGYLVSPANGIVTVAGGPQAVSVTFSPGVPPTYLVTFTETGLAPGTVWAVTLGGTPQNTSGTSITYQEPVGSYPFSVAVVPGYTVSSESGNVTVTIEDVTIPVAFSPANGWLNGTVEPSSAHLTVSEVDVSLSDGSFSVVLAPGTYAVVATAANHAPYYNNVTVYPGKQTQLAIVLFSISSTGTAPVNLEFPLIALVIGAACGCVAGFLGGRRRRREPSR